jgi:2-polyprenyl-3-methyl-5-hydroxy-6-metoxy-1,4-benzoquinol methylase
LDDVSDSWEFEILPDKEIERPALRENAINALRRIELHINKPIAERRILDYGSGWGFFLAVAKECGWTTYGLEPLPASAVYARATFGLNIVTDTLRANTYPINFFDVITSFQVFEHLPYPKMDIRNLHKMLRQDGIILIELPNIETWTLPIMKSRHRHFVQDHLNFFSINTLSQLLVSNGFSVIDFYHPTRYMSVRHLTRRWFRQYMPASLANFLQSSLQKTNLWEKTIGMNIGDIITVIGRKVQ